MSKKPINQVCNKCQQDTAHTWDASNNRYRCKSCHNAANRKYRQKAENKIKEREYRTPYVREKKRQIKAKLVAHFGGQCSMCGLADDCLSVYDFHHTDPSQKDLNIARILSWEQALGEASKCILVCANCHRRIHSKLRSNH